MNQKRIQHALQDALDEKIPASQIKLWPAVKASLVAGEYEAQQGEKMTTNHIQRKPRLAFAIVIIAVLLAILLLTPPGRTLAKNFLQLFTQTEIDSLPVPAAHIPAWDAVTMEPTLPPPAPLTSVAEAEALAGFSAAELPFVPEGFNYLGARFYGNTIHLEYETPNKAVHIIIKQSLAGFLQSDWDQVPAAGVIPVKIGDQDGEFVQGRFVLYPEDTAATWNPDAMFMTLRWEKDGLWYEISKTGLSEGVEYLDQAALIEIAESLVYKR